MRESNKCEVCGGKPDLRSLWCRECNEAYYNHLRFLRQNEAELAVWAERGVNHGQPMTDAERLATNANQSGDKQMNKDQKDRLDKVREEFDCVIGSLNKKVSELRNHITNIQCSGKRLDVVGGQSG